MKLYWKILSFIYMLQVNKISSLILESKSDKFLSHLSQNVLPHCSLIFAREGEDYTDTLNYLGDGNRKLISYQNMKFNSLEEDKSSDKPKQINKTNSGLISSRQSTQRKFIPGNVKRMSHPCKLIFFFLKSPQRVELIQNIAYTISPTFRPTSQMDLDYFVFHSPPALLEKVLLMPEWPAKIKFKLAVGVSDKEELLIKTICLFCDHGKPEVMTFDPEEGNWFGNPIEYFPNFVQKMNGAILRISAPLIPCRVEIPRPYHKFHDRFLRGMWKELFDDYLIHKFNYTIRTFIGMHVNGTPGAGGTGKKLSNGIWTGTAGDLIYGRADVSPNNAMTPTRMEVMAYSSLVDMTWLNFLTTEGEKIYTPMAVLWPFGPLMWMLILGSCALSFGIFHLITYFMSWIGIDSGEEMSYAHRGVIVKKEWGFGHQLFFIVNSFLEQDAEIPRFTPFRCFVALWLIYAMILTCVYRSILVGLLAFPPAEQIPTTFGELANSTYKVGFIKDGDAGLNTLKASDDPVYVKLLQRMEIIPGQTGLTCMENVIDKSRYACVAYDICSRYLKAKNMSDGATRKLVYAPSTTYNMYMGIGFTSGSMYKNDFDKYVGLARDTDLPNVWDIKDFYYGLRVAKNKWQKEKQKGKLTAEDSEEGGRLNTKQVSGSFWILGLGIVISTIAFVGEFVKLHKERLKLERGLIWGKMGGLFLSLKSWFNQRYGVGGNKSTFGMKIEPTKNNLLKNEADDEPLPNLEAEPDPVAILVST